jgi:hypothetical protein
VLAVEEVLVLLGADGAAQNDLVAVRREPPRRVVKDDLDDGRLLALLAKVEEQVAALGRLQVLRAAGEAQDEGNGAAEVGLAGAVAADNDVAALVQLRLGEILEAGKTRGRCERTTTRRTGLESPKRGPRGRARVRFEPGDLHAPNPACGGERERERGRCGG